MTALVTSTDRSLPEADRRRIVEHMNDDHADAVLAYARHHGGLPAAESATLVGIDLDGMDLVVSLQGASQPARIGFPTPLQDAQGAHGMLIAMAREAMAAKRPAEDGRRTEDRLDRARAAASFLREQAKTLQLATVDAEGTPDCSVAPFAFDASGAFWIFVSELSSHTANLRARPTASVMLIEDEATAGHLLARRRITLRCTASFESRGAPGAGEILAALRAKYGQVMAHLEGMHDFHLVRLMPERARLVAGFGQAFEVEPADWSRLSHVNDQGHQEARRSR